MGRPCSSDVGVRGLYFIVVGKSEGKKPLKRLRRRWDDNIRRDLREVDAHDENWLNTVQYKN